MWYMGLIHVHEPRGTVTQREGYEGLNLANQNRRKLGVFGRKLEESNSPFI